MQDTRCNFGHACLARRLDELTVQLFAFLFCSLTFGDFIFEQYIGFPEMVIGILDFYGSFFDAGFQLFIGLESRRNMRTPNSGRSLIIAWLN